MMKHAVFCGPLIPFWSDQDAPRPSRQFGWTLASQTRQSGLLKSALSLRSLIYCSLHPDRSRCQIFMPLFQLALALADRNHSDTSSQIYPLRCSHWPTVHFTHCGHQAWHPDLIASSIPPRQFNVVPSHLLENGVFFALFEHTFTTAIPSGNADLIVRESCPSASPTRPTDSTGTSWATPARRPDSPVTVPAFPNPKSHTTFSSRQDDSPLTPDNPHSFYDRRCP